MFRAAEEDDSVIDVSVQREELAKEIEDLKEEGERIAVEVRELVREVPF